MAVETMNVLKKVIKGISVARNTKTNCVGVTKIMYHET